MPRSRTRLENDDVVEILGRFRETGDVSERNRVVEAHIPLARHICSDYKNRGIELDDLVQVATVGLIKAANRFDPDRGVPFGAYASQIINGEIKRWFRDRGWSVRPPRSLIELGTRITTVRATLSQRLQRPPSIAELAEEMDVTQEDVLAALEAKEAYSSDGLVRQSDDGGETETIAVAQDDEELRRSELRQAVGSLLETLEPRDRDVVKMRFWDELSQQEIADRVGLSQMQISRILRKVLRELRATGGFL